MKPSSRGHLLSPLGRTSHGPRPTKNVPETTIVALLLTSAGRRRRASGSFGPAPSSNAPRTMADAIPILTKLASAHVCPTPALSCGPPAPIESIAVPRQLQRLVRPHRWGQVEERCRELPSPDPAYNLGYAAGAAEGLEIYFLLTLSSVPYRKHGLHLQNP